MFWNFVFWFNKVQPQGRALSILFKPQNYTEIPDTKKKEKHAKQKFSVLPAFCNSNMTSVVYSTTYLRCNTLLCAYNFCAVRNKINR